jgi:steroid 5-alpha reductase family enzyme
MFSTLLHPALTSLAACSAIMILVWLWAVRIKNGGVVDVFWSLNFPVIAIILLVMSDGFPVRVWLICGMVIAWGARLGLHLGVRVIGHIHEEEGRYAQLRKEWAPHEDRKLFWFFQMQAVSNVFLAISFLIITANRRSELHWIEYFGAVVWVVALLGEAIADWQLQRFKANPDNKGKVCNVGLWHYSRLL